MPTPRAQALVGPARAALEALQRLSTRDAPFEPADAERSFRIGMTDASHITLLPPLLAHVRALAPRVKLIAARIDERTAEALAASASLAVHASPIAIAPFTVHQHWHALAHHDGANRWLRSVVATLFLKPGSRNIRGWAQSPA